MDIFFTMLFGQPLWVWTAFTVGILGLLIFDLGVLHKKTREINIKESLSLSFFYIVLGCLFGIWVWLYLGQHSGKEYFTAFIVEKTLSMDNIFVISIIFSFLNIPRTHQHRVLFWGILGVIVLRGLMIAGGAVLVLNFTWVIYIFSVFLIITGLKMLRFNAEGSVDLENNSIFKLIQRYVRMTPQLHGDRFLVQLPHPKTQQLVWFLTPLMVALIMVELADIMFAIDSIPAVFTISQDPFVVYTSNIFAILGLRALYFSLAAILGRFYYLKISLAFVLIFIGSKVFIVDAMNLDKFPAGISLGITIVLLSLGILLSLLKTHKNR